MIGTDLVDKRRIARLWAQHGARFAEKVLHPVERAELATARNPARFLAMRWAAKEAFAKAVQTGLRPPVLMNGFYVAKTPAGAPYFQFSPAISALLAQKNIAAVHLSLSDERDYALATVLLERQK